VQSPHIARWQRANRPKMRDYGLRYRYGITQADYDRMSAEQGGLCAICQTKPVACVDHDHETKRVRGLLCQGCNTGLGRFRDSADRLARAIEYLNQEDTAFLGA